MPHIRHAKNRIIINSATDTGVGFEVGNILIAVQQSLVAGLPSSLVALLALGARATGEYRRADLKSKKTGKLVSFLDRFFNKTLATRVIGSKLARLFDQIVHNPNVGLEVSAIGLAAASVTIPIEAVLTGKTEILETLYEWGQEETILATFAAANIFNGSAARFNNQLTRNCMKAVGTFGAMTGLIMVNSTWEDIRNMLIFVPALLSNHYLVPNLIFFTGTLQSIYQTIRNVPARDILQPQLLLALGCFASSMINFVHGNNVEGFANLIWSIAFVSLDAVFKAGGLHQKYFSKTKKTKLA